MMKTSEAPFSAELYALTDKCNTFLAGNLPSQSPLIFAEKDKDGAYWEEDLENLATGHYIDNESGQTIPYTIVSIRRENDTILCQGFNAFQGERSFTLDYVRADQLPILCDCVLAGI